MPPKKGGSKDAQAKAKAVEDKTFGLKNKKGAKGQKFVQQVKQSIDATAAKKSGRGPSKKEMKEMQKAQEEEMLALFNVVPKKKAEAEEQKEELDPDTGPTFTDITQEIEYQRANVVAKTKITDAVFQEWREKKMAARRQAEEEERKDRQRRGMLTGREIFMQSQAALVDDDTAAADTDMMREIDEEQEIARMQALSLESQRRARVEAGLEPEGGGAAGDAGAGPSSSGAVITAAGVELSEADRALLDDDDDDVDLDALEQQVHAGT